MIAVMISIRHEWCEKIFALIKSIEARKNAPKCDLPAKVYIYEPIGKGDGCGKVVGEFTLWSIVTDKTRGHDALFNAGACLTEEQAVAYSGGKHLKGWVIEDLVRYEKTKNVTEFLKPCRDPYRFCDGCKHGIVKYPAWVETREDLDGVCYDTECLNTLHRPPQSWCYVEALE